MTGSSGLACVPAHGYCFLRIILFTTALAAIAPQQAIAHQPCRDGVAHPKINNVVIGPTDPTTGYFQLTIDAQNEGAIDILWRGVHVQPFFAGHPHPNPTIVYLDARCLTGPEPLKITATGGHYWECWDTYETTVAPVDATPVITNARADNSYISFDYEFPYNSSAKDVKIEILPTASHGLINVWTNTVHQKGGMSEYHSGNDGVARVTLTACNSPNLRAVAYIPLPPSDGDCDEDCSQQQCPSCVGSPVKTSSGNARYNEVDPLPATPFLPMKRSHVSRRRSRNLFGFYWTSLFDASLRTAPGAITLTTEDADDYVFEDKGAGAYVQRVPAKVTNASSLRLDPVSGWWLHGDQQSRIERAFNAAGRPVRYRDLSSGRSVEITYDANGLPTRLTDSWGNFTWIITTDTSNRLITSIGIEGRPDLIWRYNYFYFDYFGGWGWHLASVTSPAGTWRSYTYHKPANDVHYRSLETVRDGLGNVIEKHSYDGSHRSVSSFGPQGDIQSIQYQQAGRNPYESVTVVTYTTGRVEKHYLRSILGIWRTVEITGGCPTCSGAGDVVLAYDARGNVARRQDAHGYITSLTYSADGRSLLNEVTAQRPASCDPESAADRCRQTPDALASVGLVSTAQSVRSSYEYGDAAWPDKPTAIVTPSVIEVSQSRRETYTYEPVTGARATSTLAAWTIGAGGEDGRTGGQTAVVRKTTTRFYEATSCENDGRGEPCGTNTGLQPAFDPRGAFENAWLALPQPLRFRKSVEGPAGDVTSFVYYPLDASVPAALRGRLGAVKNAAGHVTRYEAYDVYGNAVRVVDPNGVTTQLDYDALGRLLTSTVKGVSGCDTAADPLCATDLVTTRVYAGAGPIQREVRPDGSVTTYTYDARSRVQTISRGPAASDLRERLEYSYDAVTGEKTLERTLAFENGGWVEKRRQSFAYDQFGRLATITHADGASVAYSYDPGGQVASVRDETHTVPNTFYTYDPAGRLTTATQTLATAVGGQIATRYAYDLHGNLVSVTDPNGNVTTYLYDDFGQLTRQSSAVTGATTYSYDNAGNLISTTDANGATTTRTYDLLGRQTAATSTRGSESEAVSWAYDAGPESDSVAAFGVGRVVSVTDPTGNTRYAYDRRGLLAAESRTIGGATSTTLFAYDANGNRSRIGFPSGSTVAYGFDFAGRPVTASREGVPLVTSARYLPFGPATEIVYGNGTRKRVAYDARYRPLTNALDAGGEAIGSYAYGHDLAGNVTRIDDLIDPSYNRAFGYDDLNRLVTANGPWGQTSFAYDPMGNLTARTSANGRNLSFTYQGSAPKLASVNDSGTVRKVTYDAAGNEIRIVETASDPREGREIVVSESSYAYTPRNHLARQNGVAYAYDGRGIRTVAIPPVRIASFSVAPAIIDGGASAQGTVTLTSPAPAEGAVVALASNHGAVNAPSNITLGAGQVAATFTVTTQAVADQTSAAMTASLNGSSQTVAVTVVPALGIAEMSLSHEELAGGQSGTGTIVLSAPAPETGLTISLSSSNPAVTVPEQVVVGGGREAGRFIITTAAVSQMTTVTITATLGASTARASITVVPLSMTVAVTPSPVYGGLDASGQVTLNGAAPNGGATVLLSTAYSGIVMPPSVTVPEGAQSATFSVSAAPVEDEISAEVRAAYGAAEARTTVKISPPVLTDFVVTPATIVGSKPLTATLTVNAPAAGEGAQLRIETSHPDLVTSAAPATVPAGQTSGNAALTTNWVAQTTPVVITATRHGVNRSTTVTLEPPPVTLSSFSITPASLIASNDATGRVVLTGAALEGGLEIELATSNRGVAAPPPSILVPAGATEATFAIPTTMVGSQTDVVITAWHATTSIQVPLRVNPPAGNYVASIDIRPAFIVGGTSASGSIALASAASGSGADVLLTSSNPSVASVPSSVRVPANQTTAAFTVTTSTVAAPAAVTVTARFGGVIQRKRVIVAPQNSVTVSSFAITPDRVVSESTTSGTVTLTAPAPYGGAAVTLEATRRNIVTMPGTVMVPEGATTASFVISADRLNASKERSVEIVATYNAVSAVATVTVTPKPLASASPQPVALCASLALAPCLTTTARDIVAQGVQDPGTPAPERQYFFYTPELNLMAETASSTAGAPPIAYEYIWFGGEPLAQVTVTTGAIHYYFTDHLGTPIVQTDTNARIVWQAEYDPYGTIDTVRRGESKHQPLRLPGQEADGRVDSAYNIFRWYRSSWGRYTQADPIGAVRRRGSQVEANHPYGYVDGNPLRFVDPLGLVKWDCGFLIGTANSPIGPGGGGMFASCRSECKNNKRVSVELASGVLGLSAGPLPGGLSAFRATLEDGTSSPNAQNLVGLVVYGSAGAWVPLGGGCSNIHLGRAQGSFGCSFTWFGGFDIGLDVYFGYSAIVDGPRESCCQ